MIGNAGASIYGINFRSLDKDKNIIYYLHKYPQHENHKDTNFENHKQMSTKHAFD